MNCETCTQAESWAAMVLWADSQEVVPELVKGFLIGSELLPKEWRDHLNSQDEMIRGDDGPSTLE